MSNPEDPWWHEALAQKQSDGLFRERKNFRSLPNGFCELSSGNSKTKLRDFASNDYFGLAHHPEIIEAAREATSKYGSGSRASALICGRTPAHIELEEQLCKFEQTESAILFPSGYAANVGTITALTGSEDMIFCDRLNHSCLVEGCQLSDAKMRVYRHDQLEQLESQLSKADEYRDRWIVTDSVFSMDGDLAPLRELCELAEKYDAKILIDEAHGTGVFGNSGRGAAEYFGVIDRITVRVGTLSKSLVSQGGFVVGDETLINWLWNSARTQMFSTALTPASCAAGAKAIQIISEHPELRQKLATNSKYFREQLSKHGLQPFGELESPIIPVLLSDPNLAIAVANELKEHGFLVAAVRPPTVPKGTSRLRITMSTHPEEDELQKLAELVAKAVSH